MILHNVVQIIKTEQIITLRMFEQKICSTYKKYGRRIINKVYSTLKM